MMRNKRVIQAVMAVLIGLVVMGQESLLAETSEGPKALAEVTEFKFDPVAEGSVVTHKFGIRNVGSEPLKIEKVETG